MNRDHLPGAAGAATVATLLMLAFACDDGASGNTHDRAGAPSAAASVEGEGRAGRGSVVDDREKAQGPVDLERPLYIISGPVDPVAYLAGWPGASTGEPPPLTGTVVLLRTGTCDPAAELAGEALADSLGPQIEPLVPAARFAQDSRLPSSRWLVAVPSSACPAAESRGRTARIDVRTRNLVDSAAAELQSVLERRGIRGVERGGGELIEVGGNLQVWVTTEAVAPENPRDRRSFFAGFVVTKDSMSLVFLHETGPYQPWFLIGAVDVAGDAYPEVLASTWQMGDEETFGLAILKRVGSDWELWKRVSLFRVTPYGD